MDAGESRAAPSPAPPPTPPPTPAAVALRGLCPRCGARTIFAGPLRFADRCSACDLDLARFNVGDGPAALVTLVLGALVVGLAIWLQLAVDPPVWVHLIWVPITLAATIWSLRLTKAGLLAAEFRTSASRDTRS